MFSLGQSQYILCLPLLLGRTKRMHGMHIRSLLGGVQQLAHMCEESKEVCFQLPPPPLRRGLGGVRTRSKRRCPEKHVENI